MDLKSALIFELNMLATWAATGTIPAKDALTALVTNGLDQLPLPGKGHTFLRWQCLSLVAGHDLSLAKLYEGHTDALAILAELDAPVVVPGETWGVWCAEVPNTQVTFSLGDVSTESIHLQPVRLRGHKAWCSGAAHLHRALVSVYDARGNRYLAAVDLSSNGISIDATPWAAVGMAQSNSVDVGFEDVPAIVIGGVDAYLTRPGFWHGGAGVAACWYGAAAAIGESARRQFSRAADPHYLAHLGSIEVALRGASNTLKNLADDIDRTPASPLTGAVVQARLQTEDAATAVMLHAGRALGAGPFCRDALFARRMVDLPVFIRQSHAERDLAFLGKELLETEDASWAL